MSEHLITALRRIAELPVNTESCWEATNAVDIATAALEAHAPAPPPPHGPYCWLIKPIGLNEEDWCFANDPSDRPDEELSVPLYALEPQQLGTVAAPLDTGTPLNTLVLRAIAAFDAMTPAQQATMLQAQRESWARGEAGIGSDAQEAAARAAFHNEAERSNG